MRDLEAPGAKLAARIASDIQSQIIADGWPVGRVIGSETDLLRVFGVSRSVLREAVRLLEHLGVATMRRGPGGGLVVTAPDAEAVAAAAIGYLEYENVTVADIVRSLLILEPMAASLAAERITEDGIDQLRLFLGSSSARRSVWDRRSALRSLIASLAGSPTLNLFVEVAANLMTWFSGRTLATETPWAAEMDKTEADVALADERLVEAVMRGDPSTAYQVASRHLRAMLRWFEATEAKLATTRRGRRDAITRPVSTTDSMRAPGLAERIRSDIANTGWQIGMNLGSEAELLAKYEVSRAVLREAVRILEHQNVAIMRRGPTGGLTVAEPTLAAVTAAAALFLSYQRVKIADLFPVRLRVELGCIDLVLANGISNLNGEFLRILKTEPTCISATGALSDDFHLQIARLTNNPILALLVRVLTAIAYHDAPGTEIEPPSELKLTMTRTAHGHHLAIAAAICDGDAAIARQRVLRHLEFLYAAVQAERTQLLNSG